MRLAWTACLLLLTIAAGCARAEPPRPLLWKVSDADNTVYLLGSFHLLRPGDYPLAASTDLAFEDAESVVFELSPAEMNDPALGQKMGEAAMRTDGKTLQQSLPEATWNELSAYTGMPSLIYEPTGPEDHIYLLPPVRYPDGKTYLKIGGDPDDLQLETEPEIRAWFRRGGRLTTRDHLHRIITGLVPTLADAPISMAACVTSPTSSSLRRAT